MRTCPLCGKSKPVEALFCEECTHRIHVDYEVSLPKVFIQGEPTEPTPESSYRTDDPLELDHRSSDLQPHSDISLEVVPESEGEIGEGRKLCQSQELESESESEFDLEYDLESEFEPEPEPGPKPDFEPERVEKRVKGKWLNVPVLVLLLPLLLFGGYAVFNNTVRKGNLERRGWDTALSMNSVKGYLDYMATFPRGAHFDDAHKALRKLKLEEAMQWERLKASNNTAELRDFLNQHPDISFAPLVEKRLDSLSWAGAVRANTAEAYSEYIHLSQQGQLRGDYIAEARQKLKELLSNLVESAITESVTE